MTANYPSWNFYPIHRPKEIFTPRSLAEAKERIEKCAAPRLAYGRGRSYGDVCQNSQGTLLDTQALNKVLSFDMQTGVFCAEAGITFAEIIQYTLPHGWFPQTTPGTKFVTMAGAIANDVHGKNQHRVGSFGCGVLALDLLRSSGEVLSCSLSNNSDLFRATIGGLGLTGLILSAKIQLTKVPGAYLSAQNYPFSSLGEFYELNERLHATHEFIFSVINAMERDLSPKGIIMAGNWVSKGSAAQIQAAQSWRLPCSQHLNLCSWLLNPWSMQIFNHVYDWRARKNTDETMQSYQSFFYPLDKIDSWNRLYGKNGFLEYQCLLPENKSNNPGVRAIFARLRQSKLRPYLAAIKHFEKNQSPGMLSFATEGTSLIFDFPFHGEKTLSLLQALDEIVFAYGGKLYPAKDARMSPESFCKSFPQLEKFAAFIDPGFGSDFWRRMNR